MQVCTHPHLPDQGQQQKQETVCAKRWIWGRGSLSLFTEQRRLSSDAKATKSCKRKLSRSTRTPRAASCRETADRISRRWSGGGRARERARSTCSGCRCRSPPPAPVLERSGGNASTRKMSRSGLPTAPIKTQRHSPGKRAQGRGHYLPVA